MGLTMNRLHMSYILVKSKVKTASSTSIRAVLDFIFREKFAVCRFCPTYRLVETITHWEQMVTAFFIICATTVLLIG